MMTSWSPLARAMTTDLAILERDRAQMVKLLALLVEDAQEAEDGAIWLRTTPERVAMVHTIIQASQEAQ